MNGSRLPKWSLLQTVTTEENSIERFSEEDKIWRQLATDMEDGAPLTRTSLRVDAEPWQPKFRKQVTSHTAICKICPYLRNYDINEHDNHANSFGFSRMQGKVELCCT